MQEVRSMSMKTVEKKAANRSGILRALFAIICILLEVGFWYFIYIVLNTYLTYFNIILRIFALILVINLYASQRKSAIKMPWIMLILTDPIFGTFLYLMIGTGAQTKNMKHRYHEIDDELMPLLTNNEKDFLDLKQVNPSAAGIASYIYKTGRYPVYHDSDVEYYDEALKGLEAQLEELKKAEHFIFMEYHAIENKESWKRIQDILVEKVNAGVEVRVFYDDMGSIGFVDTSFAKELQALGIQCQVFNPFMPGLNMFLNNRDHRKITVIDGRVGFTGGYNLANEYFGVTHPYGMWKDTGIKITGPAVKSLTVAFLEMWNASKKGKFDSDYVKYLPDFEYTPENAGYIAPYAYSPLRNTHIGEDVYINMLDKANDYCYFITPYLVLSDEMIHAMNVASMRGVDVRIITPGIPDKKVVYSVTRSFYSVLAKRGARIYEWTPGFCHAKMCVVDDKMATCGTINLDYRSLYHHFENGCFMSDCQTVLDIKKDFENMFNECKEVTEDYKEGMKATLRLGQQILRLFAGLL